MKIITSYINAWKNAFDFGGKTPRSDFWWFMLANFIVGAILTTSLENIYAIAIFIPMTAISIRRIRDAGKNPLWLAPPVAYYVVVVLMLLRIFPVVFWIILMYAAFVVVPITLVCLLFCCLPSATVIPEQTKQE